MFIDSIFRACVWGDCGEVLGVFLEDVWGGFGTCLGGCFFNFEMFFDSLGKAFEGQQTHKKPMKNA